MLAELLSVLTRLDEEFKPGFGPAKAVQNVMNVAMLRVFHFTADEITVTGFARNAKSDLGTLSLDPEIKLDPHKGFVVSIMSAINDKQFYTETQLTDFSEAGLGEALRVNIASIKKAWDKRARRRDYETPTRAIGRDKGEEPNTKTTVGK